jgi:hypothetical protein
MPIFGKNTFLRQIISNNQIGLNFLWILRSQKDKELSTLFNFKGIGPNFHHNSKYNSFSPNLYSSKLPQFPFQFHTSILNATSPKSSLCCFAASRSYSLWRELASHVASRLVLDQCIDSPSIGRNPPICICAVRKAHSASLAPWPGRWNQWVGPRRGKRGMGRAERRKNALAQPAAKSMYRADGLAALTGNYWVEKEAGERGFGCLRQKGQKIIRGNAAAVENNH